ncbi:hypothetical protein BKA93DRAFT_752488 [Sparassis latifolia]
MHCGDPCLCCKKWDSNDERGCTYFVNLRLFLSSRLQDALFVYPLRPRANSLPSDATYKVASTIAGRGTGSPGCTTEFRASSGEPKSHFDELPDSSQGCPGLSVDLRQNFDPPLSEPSSLSQTPSESDILDQSVQELATLDMEGLVPGYIHDASRLWSPPPDGLDLSCRRRAHYCYSDRGPSIALENVSKWLLPRGVVSSHTPPQNHMAYARQCQSGVVSNPSPPFLFKLETSPRGVSGSVAGRESLNDSIVTAVPEGVLDC